MHRRTADPFTSMILSFIGACIASRKVRGGMGLHLAMGVILGVVFIFLSKLSITIANNDAFSPFAAVWLPNLTFSVVGWYTYRLAQK
jgi:lipopolysaccharide export system permease protein